MKKLIRWANSRLLTVLLVGLFASDVVKGNDTFGPGLIPTGLVVTSSSRVAYRNMNVTVSAKLTRLDTGAALPGEQITFFFGAPGNPSQRVGTRVVTDLNGVAAVTFRVPASEPAGVKVVLAEYLGRGRYARPLPFTTITIR